MNVNKLNNILKNEDCNKVSDGSHSFEELYYDRMFLFSVICNQHQSKAWKSLKHDDGTMYEDYFIVGLTTKDGDFTYHYHVKYWDMFEVLDVPFAPLWDGHTRDDITRLNNI